MLQKGEMLATPLLPCSGIIGSGVTGQGCARSLPTLTQALTSSGGVSAQTPEAYMIAKNESRPRSSD